MAQSKPKTSATVTKKPPKKKAAKKGTKAGRDKTGRFQKGNKIAELWPEKAVLEKITGIWTTLTTDFEGQPPEDKNIVRVNDIKLLGEACLMHQVSKQQWNEWKEKFAKTRKDGLPNPGYSPSVSDLLENIRWLLECRLVYSGAGMDIFVLKNHYEFEDQTKVDATTKGESINNPFYEFLKQTGISTLISK